ncbi:hypothetical protein EVAR_63236_1 [Eumeta japonica]|uniref:Uncharacterized protein n=1 Tax=Eumeta variegata TaxID=151549 RepID=A0A4C1Z895_EUMVA|nr:hypothetical protein EVAR_63236_1 [Eumeta japonica]
MKWLVDVSEAREICKDRTKLKSIVSAYPSGEIDRASSLRGHARALPHAIPLFRVDPTSLSRSSCAPWMRRDRRLIKRSASWEKKTAKRKLNQRRENSGF